MSDLPALAEIIEDGKTGRLYPAENANALAKVISELIADSENRKQLGIEAKKWVEENRTWNVTIEQIPQTYQQLGVVMFDV